MGNTPNHAETQKLVSEIESLNHQIQSLRTKAQEDKYQIESLNHQIQSLRTKAQEDKYQIESLNDKIEGMNKEIEETRSNVSANGVLQQEIKTYSSKVSHLESEIKKKEEENIELRMCGAGGVRNAVVQKIVQQFVDISDGIMVDFFSECVTYIPKEKHNLFFEKLNNVCFSDQFFIDNDIDIEKTNLIQLFKNSVMVDLQEFRDVCWEDQAMSSKLTELAECVVDLLKTLEKSNPRIRFIKPRKGDFFNPEKHESSNVTPTQILTTKTPGLVSTFGGEVFKKAIVIVKEN